MKTTDVQEFRGEYSFLSNFYLCDVPLEIDNGKIGVFPSSEHAFMYLKAPENPVWQQTCLSPAVSPSYVKKLGRKVKMTRTDWNTYRLIAMETVLRAKFNTNTYLRIKLLKIDGLIEEGNNWGDVFWGVDNITREGANHLGKLLMKIRDSYKPE